MHLVNPVEPLSKDDALAQLLQKRKEKSLPTTKSEGSIERILEEKNLLASGLCQNSPILPFSLELENDTFSSLFELLVILKSYMKTMAGDEGLDEKRDYFIIVFANLLKKHFRIMGSYLNESGFFFAEKPFSLLRFF